MSVVRHTTATLLGHGLTLLISVVGLVAFAYPFFLAVVPQDNSIQVRSSDAPLIFGILMPLLLLLIVADLSSRRMNAKLVAVMGVLVAINAVLRLPTGLGDSPTFFFLPILLGYAYGTRFGFLHGSLSLFVSALLTAGIGPWLPFQMLAMGWLGMAAAMLRFFRLPAGSWREVIILAAYGYAAGLGYGLLINLYFWPFQSFGTALGWQPGLSLLETARRYWAFYVVWSLAWDALRALSTATLILVLGKPLLRELRRFRSRFFWLAEQA